MLSLRSDGSAGTATKFDLPSETMDIMAGWTKDNLGVLIPVERQTSICTVPATGGKATQLTTEYAAVPNWTPDGKAIYFDGAYGDEDYAAIEFMPASGGKVTRVPIDKEFEFLQPSYPLAGISLSPDGKTICYAGFYGRGGTPGSAIYLLPREGGRPERLTANTMGDLQPAWSPDGRQIAFIRRKRLAYVSEAVLWTTSRNGGRPTRVETGLDDSRMARIDWSPDGRTIAFEATKGGEHELWLMEDFLSLVNGGRR